MPRVMTGLGFTDAVVGVIEALQPGDVMSYGEIAAEAGYPGAARAVGSLLRTTPGLPWWRVVTASGRLAPGHEVRQSELLSAEGVKVHDGRVVETTHDDPATWRDTDGNMNRSRFDAGA